MQVGPEMEDLVQLAGTLGAEYAIGRNTAAQLITMSSYIHVCE